MIGIAGLDELQRIRMVQHCLNGAGNPASLMQRSTRLGDIAAQTKWDQAFWFADFAYVVKTTKAGVEWREGRSQVFRRGCRTMPLLLDSSGYRREIAGTAPKWAHQLTAYLEAIDLIDPDGYAAFDYPDDQARSLQTLRQMESMVGRDERLWPVWSVRWLWDPYARLQSGAPAWAQSNLANLVPLTRTQRKYRPELLEMWARQAIANAFRLGQNPMFREIADTHGKVMLGGLVRSPMQRIVRHIFAAVVAHMYPSIDLWLLGGCSPSIINGLARLDLLDKVTLDGTTFLRNAVAERIMILDDGLLTELSLESKHRMRSFFSLPELVACNLRASLSATHGLGNWPTVKWPPDMPYKPVPQEMLVEMMPQVRAAQLELGI